MNLNQEISLKSLKVDFKNNVSRYYAIVTIIWILAIIFFTSAGILSFLAYNTYIEKTDRQLTLNSKQGEASYLQTAEEIASEEVDAYNQLLARLVPETEDYFSVIASLERLSLRTGLEISRYALDLPEDGAERFTLSVVGTVPLEDLPRFLDTYKYGTGRLVTIDNIQVTNSAENNVRFNMSFYSKQVDEKTLSRVATLSDEDISLIQEIVTQIQKSEDQANEGRGVDTIESIIPDLLR